MGQVIIGQGWTARCHERRNSRRGSGYRSSHRRTPALVQSVGSPFAPAANGMTDRPVIT